MSAGLLTLATMIEARLMSTRQAAIYLNIHWHGVLWLVKKGFLRRVALPAWSSTSETVTRLVLDRVDLDAFIEAHKRDGMPVAKSKGWPSKREVVAMSDNEMQTALAQDVVVARVSDDHNVSENSK